MTPKMRRILAENSKYNRKHLKPSQSRFGKKRAKYNLPEGTVKQNPANYCLPRGSHKKWQKRVGKDTYLFWESLHTDEGWVPETNLTRAIGPKHWKDVGDTNMGSLGSDDIPDNEIAINVNNKKNPGKSAYDDKLDFENKAQMSAYFERRFSS